MDDLAANPNQVERLRRATRKEIEQGISREIASIEEARQEAVARAQSLERECARLTEENAVLDSQVNRLINAKRDGFAAAAMASMVSVALNGVHGYDESAVAKSSYLMADAMLAARENKHD